MHRLFLALQAAVVVTALAMVAACGASPSAKNVTAPTVAASTIASIEAAETAERARDHDLARNQYLRAIAEAPDNQSQVYARRAFVETLLSWGELPDASQQLVALTVAVPSDPVPWHDLGIVLSVIGTDLEGAEAALTTARDLAPADVRPRIALAALRWRRGNRDGAEEEYRALLTLELTDALRSKVQWALTTLNASRTAPPP